MKYKIEISEVTEKEVPVTEFMNTRKKDDDGIDIYGYVKTGKTKIERDERVIYEQELEDLSVSNLVTYINDRAK